VTGSIDTGYFEWLEIAICAGTRYQSCIHTEDKNNPNVHTFLPGIFLQALQVLETSAPRD
jgi:hypothetical protein